MKLKELALEHRPRERLQRQGSGALSTAELLAIILRSGSKTENVLDLSQRLLANPDFLKLSYPQLIQAKGIGPAKACQILAFVELIKRFIIPKMEGTIVKCAEDITGIYVPKLSSLEKEQCMVIYLDTKNKIIKDEIVSIGILNASLIHPREIFHGAIKNLANSIIVLHNHPSGDPTPSEEDLKVTKRLYRTGELLGIQLLDHIIIAGSSYWSWSSAEVK
ncbi:MAG TPA: DNA repair protein RadC [Candidatus Nanoarchaeia archaeon]|nr:DNA repair protein RadC [Candidatus Nanoarchaeia archaeon]